MSSSAKPAQGPLFFNKLNLANSFKIHQNWWSFENNLKKYPLFSFRFYFLVISFFPTK